MPSKTDQQTIDVVPMNQHPAVAEGTARLDRLLSRLAEVEARQAELLPTADGAAVVRNLEADAARLRAGQPLDFAADPEPVSPRELARLDAEAAALRLAIGQEEEALTLAQRAAGEAALGKLVPRLAAIDRETADAFRSFLRTRDKRREVAELLIGAGYSDVGLTVASTGILANFGSLTDPRSPAALLLQDLVARGLVSK